MQERRKRECKKVHGHQQLVLRALGSGHVVCWGSMEMPGLQQDPSQRVLCWPHQPRIHFLLLPSGKKIIECSLDGDGMERGK